MPQSASKGDWPCTSRSFNSNSADNVRIVVAGRQPPVSAWHTASGWHGLFQALPVDALGDADALEVLHHLGVDETDARRVNRFAGGHPLALRLAASALRERPDLNFEERTIPHVVEALTRTYLADARPWGADYDGGSNVVVRGLRAKLGERAAMIETLRGRGYRIRSD